MDGAFVGWGEFLGAQMFGLGISGECSNLATAAGTANDPALRHRNHGHTSNVAKGRRSVNRVQPSQTLSNETQSQTQKVRESMRLRKRTYKLIRQLSELKYGQDTEAPSGKGSPSAFLSGYLR